MRDEVTHEVTHECTFMEHVVLLQPKAAEFTVFYHVTDHLQSCHWVTGQSRSRGSSASLFRETMRGTCSWCT
jgi:hypothetical protein